MAPLDSVLRPARPALSIAAGAAVEANRLRRQRQWISAVARVGRHRDLLVAGPWISEVGFEVLYWIPLLRHIAARRKLTRERMTVITRGGAACWYADLAAAGVEIFDLMAPDELRRRNEERVALTGGQKHMGLTALDEELVRRAADRLDPRAELVHPSLMYNAFRGFWGGRQTPREVLRLQRHASLPDPGRDDIRERLPAEYVAVKAYHSSSFPDVPANRAFVAELVRGLAERTTVVLLSTGLAVDDHSDVPVDGGSRIIDARAWMTPRDNIEVQTQIVRGASALVSSYGGFSYLGPLLGVPSVCFWSHENFNPVHLRYARGVAESLGAPPFAALSVRELEMLDDVLGPLLAPPVGALA